MLNSPLIADLIFKGEVHEIKEIMKRSRELGMQTFDQALFDLYDNGIISYEDALRNADSVNDLRLAIKLHSQGSEEPRHHPGHRAPGHRQVTARVARVIPAQAGIQEGPALPALRFFRCYSAGRRSRCFSPWISLQHRALSTVAARRRRGSRRASSCSALMLAP